MSLYSYEAEQNVLGACLLDNNVIGRVADIVTPNDFYAFENRLVWQAVAELHRLGKQVDVMTVADSVGAHEERSVISFADIAEIARHTVSTANATAYADIVADLGLRRRIGAECNEVRDMASDKEITADSVIESAQAKLARLLRADSDMAGPMSDDLADMINEIERKWEGEESPMGLSFGLKDLDDKTMGMHPGQLIIVGGRPGQGKTAFALNVLRACCVRDNKPALIFSMEMDRRALRNRMTAAVGDMPIDAIRDPQKHMNDERWQKLATSVKLLNDAPLIIDARAAITASQIHSAAKRWRDRYGDMGVIMVDYLQLMGNDNAKGSNRNREQEVAEISRSMKMLAKEMQCPVVALSQLNRSLESRTDKRPLMSDLRESGSLEQDADLILFLYRDEYYNEESPVAGIAEIIVGKQREGSTGTVFAASKLAHARFDDLVASEIVRAREMSAQAAKKPVKKQKSAMANF